MEKEQLPIVMNLSGPLADKHLLPAYKAGESIAGVSRAIELTMYYMSEEKVRHKDPNLKSFNLNIAASKPGSFEFIFELIANPDLFANIAFGVTGSGIYDFIKYMLGKTTGQNVRPDTEVVQRLENEKGGDLEALADAIEPSIRRAHSPINNGVSNIIIINGDSNNIIFDKKTKEYVSSREIDYKTKAKVYSISSFNVNSGYGRAFDKEYGYSIPFQITSDADPQTSAIIASSLQRYAKEDEPWIELKHDQVVTPSGVTKKLLVRGAREIRE